MLKIINIRMLIKTDHIEIAVQFIIIPPSSAQCKVTHTLSYSPHFLSFLLNLFLRNLTEALFKVTAIHKMT
jgi:hypothetical protein